MKHRIYKYIWNYQISNKTYIIAISIVAFVVGLGGFSISLPDLPFASQRLPGKWCRKYTPATFGEKIVAIECKVGKWKQPGDLLQSKDFLAIYQHPKYYYDHIWSVLDSCWFTAEQKKIVVYAMEQLPLVDYLCFVDKVYKNYPSGRLKKALFAILLGGQSLYKHPLVEHGTHPTVIDLLIDLKAKGTLPFSLFENKQLGNKTDIKQIQSYIPAPITLKETIDYILQTEREKHQQEDPYIGMGELSQYDNFIAIYTHPDCYIEEAIAILEGTYPEKYADLVLQTMAQLGAVNYIHLVSTCIKAYLKGILPFHILYWCMADKHHFFLDGYNDRGAYNHLIMDYKNQALQSMLEHILTNRDVPVKVKIRIADIKSGKATIDKQAYGNHKKQRARIIFHETIGVTRYWDTILMLCGILVVIVYYGRKLSILLDKVALRKDWR
ncbi:MAG: hypothetical protein K2X94_04805 [Amoebophilaceae bacterium]|nr:hypothetical protein [Amoebophilaceae bacterium]